MDKSSKKITSSSSSSSNSPTFYKKRSAILDFTPESLKFENDSSDDCQEETKIIKNNKKFTLDLHNINNLKKNLKTYENDNLKDSNKIIPDKINKDVNINENSNKNFNQFEKVIKDSEENFNKNQSNNLYSNLDKKFIKNDDENLDFENTCEKHFNKHNVFVENQLSNLSIDEKAKLYNEIINENTSASSTNCMFNTNLIKSIASKNKIRFSQCGFDLDLTYITDCIIAMGFPAANYEKIFRNSMGETLRFFDERHKGHYKIYNLCSERNYPENTFENQSYFPFDDHEAPPLNLILPFCLDMKNWLDMHPSNVAAVHCKAGKGRTGTFICCFLLFIRLFNSAESVINFYGMMRTSNGKGVTIPSQKRYIYYFEKLMDIFTKNNGNSKIIDHLVFIEAPKVTLKLIIFNSLPNFGRWEFSCTPYFKVYNNSDEDIYNFKTVDEKKTYYYQKDQTIEFEVKELQLQGDVKIVFWNKKFLGKEKMFQFWFNTFFIPKDGHLELTKVELDKAWKDKQHLKFFQNFKIYLYFKIEKYEIEKKEKFIGSFK